VLIAARSGAVSWLQLGTRWPHAAAAAVFGGFAWAAGWRLSPAPVRRPPAWLPILALVAAVGGVYTANDPHWVYASAGQMEGWAVQRQEVIEGLPDQPGESCQLPIGAAETLGPRRLPLRMVSRYRTSRRIVVLCATKYLGLVMLTVPQSEDEGMRAQPAIVEADGLVVGDPRPDGLHEHVNALEWWTTDPNEVTVTTEAVIDVQA
jgi:hypothetical protein